MLEIEGNMLFLLCFVLFEKEVSYIGNLGSSLPDGNIFCHSVANTEVMWPLIIKVLSFLQLVIPFSSLPVHQQSHAETK